MELEFQLMAACMHVPCTSALWQGGTALVDCRSLNEQSINQSIYWKFSITDHQNSYGISFKQFQNIHYLLMGYKIIFMHGCVRIYVAVAIAMLTHEQHLQFHNLSIRTYMHHHMPTMPRHAYTAKLRMPL